MANTFLTGFGPFDAFEVNPSERLVRSLPEFPFEILEVAFGAVDEFLGRGIPDECANLLMLGVSEQADGLRLETVARNHIGDRSDVLGVMRGPTIVHSAAVDELEGSLFSGYETTEDWALSSDAGNYLCNYAYYEAIRRLHTRRVGFLHVPPFEKLDFESQRNRILKLLGRIETETS